VTGVWWVLVDGRQRAGVYQVAWDGRDDQNRTVPAGIYFCRFQAGDYLDKQKLLIQH